MATRTSCPRMTTLAAVALSVSGSAFAAPMQGEVELKAATKAEEAAGVWVDGQYLGHVEELNHKGRLVLVPGDHALLVKLAGYESLADTIVVEPDRRREYRVALRRDANATYPEKAETAKLRISVEPEEAAVFVNDVYAGHVDRFNGHKGLRMRAGSYRVRIALPGYQPFETELTLLVNQTYEIKTTLPRGSIMQQPEGLVIPLARD
jgi:PEGA domain